jgi:hypothetical protein
MKQGLIILIGVAMIVMTSCFSHYPIQKKFPCEDSTIQEKLEMIGDAIKSNTKIKDKHPLILTEEGVSYNKIDFKFKELLYVRLQEKKGPGGKKYWIDIREFNRDLNKIYLRDHSLMEKANNALMCLAGLQATNGRPSKGAAPVVKSNKYEDLEKLNGLLKSGAITQEEFDAEKKKILNK